MARCQRLIGSGKHSQKVTADHSSLQHRIKNCCDRPCLPQSHLTPSSDTPEADIRISSHSLTRLIDVRHSSLVQRLKLAFGRRVPTIAGSRRIRASRGIHCTHLFSNMREIEIYLLKHANRVDLNQAGSPSRSSQTGPF